MDNGKLKKIYNLTSLIFHLLRKVNNLVRRIENGQFKLEIFSKGHDDSFTSADYIIQKMFENNLEKYFPEIQIVGEEDTSLNTIKDSEYFIVEQEEQIDFNFIKSDLFSPEADKIILEDIVFYIDPIDSTSSFIKKNYTPSTVMIGLTIKEEPYLGILHYFCWQGKKDKTKTIFNLPGKGIFEIDLDTNEMSKMNFNKSNKDLVIVTSKSRTIPNIWKCFEFFENSKVEFVSGLGHKCFKIMEEDALYISSCRDLGFWDSCTGHCLLNEIGGGFYYFDGSKVKYDITNNNRRMKDYFMICANDEKKNLFFSVYEKNKKYFDEYLNDK